MHSLAKKYLRTDQLPTLFCPGCGDGIILNCFVRTIDEKPIENLSLVGGIGCSGWIPVYVKKDVIHTIHGRAIPVATGLKLSNHKLNVVVFTGDGDCVGIGGNHFIHAARRNMDLTVIMVNNMLYGMTGGQLAPTTPEGATVQTAPLGNPEKPFDVCKLAETAGATYVARTTTSHPYQIIQFMKKGMEHEGFSYIEVVSQCPTHFGRYVLKEKDPAALLEYFKANSVSKEKYNKLSAQDRQAKIAIGEFVDNEGHD